MCAQGEHASTTERSEAGLESGPSCFETRVLTTAAQFFCISNFNSGVKQQSLLVTFVL